MQRGAGSGRRAATQWHTSWRASAGRIWCDVRHKSTAVPVIEPPTDEVFVTEWLQPGRPVVLRGLGAGWPAVRLWSNPDYLISRAGDSHALLSVERSESGVFSYHSTHQRVTVPLEIFLTHLKASASSAEPGQIYCAQTPLQEIGLLADDIEVPSYIDAEGTDENAARFTNLWMGYNGAAYPCPSPQHTHAHTHTHTHTPITCVIPPTCSEDAAALGFGGEPSGPG